MQRLYSLLLYLLSPLVLAYLALRGLRNRGYLQRWPERFGLFDPPQATGGIALHAVSVGEVNAAVPLIRRLLKISPESPLSVTTFTPTGSERVRSVFGADVFHVYAPLDFPGAVKRFFDRRRPGLVIVMETEIWPNFYREASRRGTPLVMLNARLSERSARRYRPFRDLTAPTLRLVARIGAQTQADARRLVDLGALAGRVTITGNLKFDFDRPPSLHERGESVRMAWGAHRPVLVAGSTHEEDEIPLLRAFSALLKKRPEALLVLAPRHPERFTRSVQLARSAGLRVSLRSEGMSCPADNQCFVVDTIGELLLFYAAGDVAFVGGTLASVGGHNVLEPAALGKPVVIGPQTFNIAEITSELLERRAAIQVDGAAGLQEALQRLFADPDLRDRMGQAGRALVESGRGALQRSLELIEQELTPAVR